MTRVTFLAEVAPEEYASELVLTVLRPNGTVVLRDEFHLGILVPTAKYVDMVPGDYLIHGRCDGYIVPWMHPINIPDQEEELSITIPVTTSQPADVTDDILLFGWVKGLNSDPTSGKQEPSPLASRYHGTYTFATRVDRYLTFKELTQKSVVDLLTKSTIDVGVDRNGYFEISLKPEVWYECVIPGKSPLKFQMPATGPVDFSTLLTQSTRTFLYNLR